MLNKVILLIGTIALAGGVLVVFFGGTWEGARIGLEIMGGIWLLQTSYKVIIDDREAKIKAQEAKEFSDQYFKAR